VASQALISGVFSIMRQAMMLRLLPRMKVGIGGGWGGVWGWGFAAVVWCACQWCAVRVPWRPCFGCVRKGAGLAPDGPACASRALVQDPYLERPQITHTDASVEGQIYIGQARPGWGRGEAVHARRPSPACRCAHAPTPDHVFPSPAR
jgi:hypothetical protein